MSRLRRLVVEIHHRSLWQVLLIYVGAGWIVFEIVQTVTEGLGLPQWFPAFAALLLLIGLPIVLATAFVREGEPATTVSDPTLIPVDEPRTEAARRRRFLTWRNAVASFVVALAVWGVVATGWLLFGERAAGSEDERKSIAVLPFENLSPNADDAYFADGIHEEIISQLGIIASLKVISRTSVMEYRDRAENLRTIADELGVTHVLEGSVRRAGDRVRITTQLIAAEEDEHLWAENYERELSDIFAVQSDVAQQIAAALRATLTPAERERIDKQPTENLEAYDFFLRALGLPRSSENRIDRIQLLERAIELDSSFALAHAELSFAHTTMFYQQQDRTQERLAMAKQAADRALQLDPELAEAHAALGYYFGQLGDRERAAQYYDEALRLDPNNERAIRVVAARLLREGRAEEAMATYLKALARNPRDYTWTWNTAARFHYFHDFENAERYFDRAISLRPDDWPARVYKGLLYLAWSGDTAKAHATLPEGVCGFPTFSLAQATWRLCDEAQYERGLSLLRDSLVSRAEMPGTVVLAELFIIKAWLHGRRGEAEQGRAAYDSTRIILEPRVRELPDDAMMHGALGIAYAGLGRREEAIREGRRGVDLEPDDWFYQTPSRVLNLARIYKMVGEYDLAVEQLETLPTDRGLVTPTWLGADPLWEPLRDHPRFQALLDKYGSGNQSLSATR